MISHSRLKKLLHYNPATGVFTNRTKRPGRNSGIGRIAGTQKTSGTSPGYCHICLDRKEYRAHRLAWFYVYGYWPPNDIDHINGKRDDNRITNLRLATRQENIRAGRGRPGKSKYKGVSFNPKPLKKPWYVRIWDGKKLHRLGYFATEDEAGAAYTKKAKELFGEFAHSPEDIQRALGGDD